MKSKFIISLKLAVFASSFLAFSFESYAQFPIPTNGLNGDANSTAVGTSALAATAGATTTGNSAFGNGTLASNISGSNNTALGALAMGGSNNGITLTRNVAVGGAAMFPVRTGDNVGVGFESLRVYDDLLGGGNTALGARSLALFKLGGTNVALGSGAMRFIRSTTFRSESNTVVGTEAMIGQGGPTMAFGSGNTVVGFRALNDIISGSNNVAIGNFALGAPSFTGSANVAIGSSANVPNAAINNQLSIQNTIWGINMGGGNGNVGIRVVPIAVPAGSIVPAGTFTALHVGGAGSAPVPSLQLDNVPIVANPTGRYLYVDAAGVVGQTTLPGTTGYNSCPNVGFLPVTNNINGNMSCSQVFDNGVNVGIGLGITAPASKLDINCISNGSDGHIRLRNLAQYSSTTELKTLIIDPVTYEVWIGSSSNNRQSNTCSLDCDAIDNAIKTQQSQIDEQKVQIANQQSEINELKNKINQLIPGNVIVKVDNFQITPNPVTGTSTVNYKMDVSINNAIFIVYDLQGKMLKKYSVDINAKQGQVQISKKDFGNGMYILSLVSDGVEIQSKKFLIAD